MIEKKKKEKNNIVIVLNVLHTKNKYSMLMFQNITQNVKQVIFLIILNGGSWDYIAVKKLPALLRELLSKH